MEPVPFKYANLNLMGKGCYDLPVFSDGTRCISRWKLTLPEVRLLAQDGSIWLHVWSPGTMPPVWVSVDDPFINRCTTEEPVMPCRVCQRKDRPQVDGICADGTCPPPPPVKVCPFKACAAALVGAADVEAVLRRHFPNGL